MTKAVQSEITGAHIEQLTEQVSRLTDALRVVKDAIDDLRDDLEYAVRNKQPLPPPLHITSMPHDPTVPDFHARLNAVKFEQPSADHPQNETPIRGTQQQSLWSQDD